MAPGITDPYEAAAAQLREKEARLVAELDAVRKSLAAIEAARTAAGFAQGSYAITTIASKTAQPDIVMVDKDGSVAVAEVKVADKYKGLGLEQAATKYLSECSAEQTAKQIWSALSAAGYSLLSDRPEQSVSWALRKREKKRGDVILVGNGFWGMTDWYPSEKLEELRAARNNASTRNHEEHVERTKAGIANAIENRLTHWGRGRTISVEQMERAWYALKSGASRLQAAKAGGMVWPTLAYYWNNFEMENWRPGEPFPPKRRATPKKTADVTRENLWPRASELFKGEENANGSQH